MSGGEFRLRSDVLELLASFENRLVAMMGCDSRARDVVRVMSAEACESGVSPDGSTHVVYAITLRAEYDGPFADEMRFKVYIGMTMGTCAQRMKFHPGKCPILEAAFGATDSGRDDWVIAPLISLPKCMRSLELLLVFEEAAQRILETVYTKDGMNAQYGAGKYGGAQDDELWRENLEAVRAFIVDNAKYPSMNAIEYDERRLGLWVANQRANKDKLSAHRRDILDELSWWKWRVNASPTSSSDKIAALLEHPSVKESGGWLMPSERPFAKWADQLRQAYKDPGKRGRVVLTDDDRSAITTQLVGLTVSGGEASFMHNATVFASKFLDATTLRIREPSRKNDAAMHAWLKHVRDGTILLTDTKKEFLESVSLGAILTTLRSPSSRERTAMKMKETSGRRNDAVNEENKRRRLERTSALREHAETPIA